MAKRTFLSSIGRLAAVIGVTMAVVASLLTFPSGVPWMIAGWLLWHSVQVARGRPGWVPLATCIVVVLVKRGDLPWTLLLLGGAVLVIVVVRMVPATRRLAISRRWVQAATVAVVWMAWAGFVWQWHDATQTSRVTALDKERPVVCLGDSLTAAGYPQELQELLSIPVVDMSREGATTEHAIKRLPELIAANPQSVVVEIGGNDYVKGKSQAATRQNIEKILAACRKSGAAVLLVEIPRGFVSDPYGGLERELARRHDLQLMSDTPIRQLVLWSPEAPPGMWFDKSQHLSNDGLHPNDRGNRHLARCVAAELTEAFGSEIQN